MSLDMLRHNIEILQDVCNQYSKETELKKKFTLKNQILFLTTSINKLLENDN
ncbi:hypothetical protein J4459_03325 [Candidatus Woesearchaeota archaeon]|nr:hypothetical protein [Candidatus Woesearchaeota archaeon]